MIRNTLGYVASKDQKSSMKELRLVHPAPTVEAALIALNRLEENWGKKYSLSIRTWRQNWNHAATFFKYPDEIRKIIYTTNAVEAVHRQFRKVTKQRSIFPNSLSRFIGYDSLKKMLFLVYRWHCHKK
jgi:transposase-like protein